MYLELLSPARNLDIGIAAIDSGADAVYIGGPFFGARKDAGNSVEDIATLCSYAHRFGARVFVTFNISVSEEEIPEMHGMMLACQDAGADAFIVRDERIFGWKDITVPLHASTQCAIRTVEDARRYEALGAARLVLERELSLADIKAIREAVSCELECFVHGALCVCYSGDCRLSEYLDGRSADRGECIQACRSLYDLVDTSGRVLVRDKALLSLRDFNLLARLQELAKAGVCSFKIEGRLKNAAYVRNVTRAYSIALDALCGEGGEGAPPSGVRPSDSPHHPSGAVPPLPCRGWHVPQGECLPASTTAAPLGGSTSASLLEAWGNFLRIRGGAVVQSLNLGFKARIEETEASVLSTFIAEIESKFGGLSKEIVVPFLPDVDIPGVSFTVPQRGDKLALLELSAKNAREYRAGTLRQREHTDPDAFHRGVLAELQKALEMPVLPEHMECFDNSNIQGTNPVASCVVFRGGVPSKKDYRRFKIKTVVGANDYASMKEVVNRRYSRMLAEAPDDLPQLVVIDGGKGQLEFAWQALCELGIQDRLTVVGLAKRLEEVIRVGDPYPLFLDRNSQALRLLQQIRDEAHRFGITFHRNLRSKAAVKSALDDIPGVGPKTAERLLMHYGSVARIAAADSQDLINFVGPALAARIRKALAPDLFDNDERKDIQ